MFLIFILLWSARNENVYFFLIVVRARDLKKGKRHVSAAPGAVTLREI